MSLRSEPLFPRVGVGSVSSPLEVGADRAPQAANELAALLEKSGCTVVPLGPIGTADDAVAAGRKLAAAQIDAIALAVASWFEDYLALDLLEECRAPLLLWSLPGVQTGAACGVQQLTCILRQLGDPYRGVHGPLGAPQPLSDARAYLRAAALKSRLRRARIGMVGHHVAGMTEAAVDEIALKKAIGPRVVPIDLPGLLARAAAVDEHAAGAAWRQVVERAAVCHVPEAAGVDAMRLHAALRETTAEHGLSALAVGCYPHLMGRVCLAASLLADEGVPLACEGDVNGAVGQLLLHWLSGEPTHNTDWLEPLEDGTVVFTHCGSGSFRLAERPEAVALEPVRLLNRGVCALFPARPGPVTLVNLLPAGGNGYGGGHGGGYQCSLLEGQAVHTEMVFPGNPVRVRLAEPVGVVQSWIHASGIGHHWMIGYGHVAGEIRAWAGLAGDGVRLIEPRMPAAQD